MVTNDYPKSHIQLLVPLHYKYGGKVAILGDATLFDGDPDTYSLVHGSISTIIFNYGVAVNPKWAYLWQNSGGQTGGDWTIDDASATTLDHFSRYEEWQWQHDNLWNVVVTDNKIQRIGSSAIYSNLLVELDNSSSFNSLRFMANAVTATSSIQQRGLVFSENFTVPMYGKGFNSGYSFSDIKTNRNPAGIKLANYSLARSVRLRGVHHFNWSGLSIVDKEGFDSFFDAFNGQLSQPFVMCVINGNNPYTDSEAFNTMESKMLILDQETIQRGRDRQGDYKVSFTARELFANI